MVSIVSRAELIARSAKTRPRLSGPEAQRAGSREPLRRAPSKFYAGLRGENSRPGPEVPHGTPPSELTESPSQEASAIRQTVLLADTLPEDNRLEIRIVEDRIFARHRKRGIVGISLKLAAHHAGSMPAADWCLTAQERRIHPLSGSPVGVEYSHLCNQSSRAGMVCGNKGTDRRPGVKSGKGVQTQIGEKWRCMRERHHFANCQTVECLFVDWR
jgi:hypothetical protein